MCYVKNIIYIYMCVCTLTYIILLYCSHSPCLWNLYLRCMRIPKLLTLHPKLLIGTYFYICIFNFLFYCLFRSYYNYLSYSKFLKFNLILFSKKYTYWNYTYCKIYFKYFKMCLLFFGCYKKNTYRSLLIISKENV